MLIKNKWGEKEMAPHLALANMKQIKLWILIK